MPNFAGNQSSASGSTLVRPQRRSSSSPSLLSESSESDDWGVTGLGVRGVASQSLPSVRQLSGAATGVFSGEGKGGTGGGLTVFVGVGAAFATGLGLDGGFVGLASEVGVTGASGAGGFETLQPILGLGNVSQSAASSRATEGPRVEWCVCVVERGRPFVRRAQYKSGQLNLLKVFLVSYPAS
jgi:hypothetical protein